MSALTIVALGAARNLDAVDGLSGGVGARLACTFSQAPTPQAVQLSCKLENLAGEEIVVLLSDAILDGPIGTPGYLDKLAGGQRFENVLQFGVGPKKGFNRGSFSHPWVDLTDGDLERLHRVANGGSTNIEIQVDSASVAQSSDVVRLRLKLVYATAMMLRSVQRRSDLSAGCRELIEAALKNESPVGPNRIGARRSEPGLRVLLDHCHDTISGQFHHVYSDIIDMRLPVLQHDQSR